MKITLAVVGKIKEKYWTLAIDEYVKRLSRYASVSICQVPDEPAPERASAAQEMQIKQREGERLLREISKCEGTGDVRVIALAIDGKMYDSVSFSEHLDDLQVNGYSHFIFLIGGSLGICDEVLRRADEMINEATVHTNELVNEHEIMQQAYAQANEIVRLATQQGQDILDKAVSEANAYRTSAAQYMDDMLAQLEESTVGAQNSLTSIFSTFHTNMSEYIDTVRQNRAELLPQNEEAYEEPAQEQDAQYSEEPHEENRSSGDIDMM